MEKLETKLNFAGQWQNNKVMLKWIPDNIELLRFGQQYGFKVERCNYSSDLKESFDKYEYEELTQSPILPWSVTKLENYLNANPDFIGTKDYENLSLAYELTIGADSIASSRFAADILSNKDAFSKAVNSQNYNYIITILTAAFSNIAAEAIGLFCIDDSIKNGIKYIYKLSLIKNDSNIDVSPSYVVIENTINFTNKPSIKVKEGEKSISLLWDKANDYLAYNVYYSSNNKISFKKANSVPILNNNVQGYEGPQFSSFSKDSLVNFQEYHFIVKGLNFFGDEIEIGTAKGTPKDLTAPERPILFNVIHKEPKLAKIEWKQLCDSIEVWGYKIYRSESLNGKYSIIHDSIIPANWRSFNDSYFDIDTSNYYIVSAIDIYGNQSYSDPLYLTLVDSVPPAMPKPILGKMDSLGIVTLKMENQTEKDFMGYRIYKANADDHEFSVVQETYNDTIVVNARNTTIIDTSTLESLTKYVYYKITALDYHYNESKFSPIIKVKRPDKIRPTSPLISDVNLTAAGVTLTVTLSSSEDVVVNNVFKRVKGDSDWVLAKEIKDSTYSFTDTLIKPGVKYEYTMNAIDDSGLISEYGNIIGIGGISYPVKVIQKFDGKFISNQNILSWELDPSKSKPTSYFIFRSDNKKGYRLIKKLESPLTLEFVDNVIKENTIYDYVIQPRAKDIEYFDSDVLSITSGVQK